MVLLSLIPVSIGAYTPHYAIDIFVGLTSSVNGTISAAVFLCQSFNYSCCALHYNGQILSWFQSFGGFKGTDLNQISLNSLPCFVGIATQ